MQCDFPLVASGQAGIQYLIKLLLVMMLDIYCVVTKCDKSQEGGEAVVCNILL
jgi:hypothetical protein